MKKMQDRAHIDLSTLNANITLTIKPQYLVFKVQGKNNFHSSLRQFELLFSYIYSINFENFLYLI